MSGSSPTDSYNSSSGAYSAGSAGTAGNICSNQNIQMSGSSTIHGNATPGSGYSVSMSGSAAVTGTTTAATTALSEPAVNIAAAASK